MIAHLIPCHEESMFITKYKKISKGNTSQFSNTYVHLGYHSIITKVFQVFSSAMFKCQIAKFNQNILICTISMSDLFNQTKMSGVFIRVFMLLA